MSTIYYGVDISDNQEPITWSTLASAVTTNGFIMIKAAGFESSNTLVTQSDITTNMAQVRSYGIPHGFYFFVDQNHYGNVSAATAASYFISVLGTLQTGEIVVLDFDSNGVAYSSAMDTWCAAFCNALKTNYSFNPTFYTSESLAASGAWTSTAPITNLWIADYSYAATDYSHTVSAWSASSPNYRFLQYSSSGSGSSYGVGSSNIDLDSFYSPNSTISDFTALGYGGGPPPFVPVPTSVTSSSSYQQAAVLNISTPENQYDKVIYSNTYDFTVANSTGATVYSINTGLDQLTYPFGIFSFDGGETWNDIGATINTGYISGLSFPQVGVDVHTFDTGVINLTVNVLQALPSGSTIPMIVSFALLATPDPSPILSTVLEQTISHSSNTVQSSFITYRRIAADMTQTADGTNYALTAIPHGQSTIPNIIYWGIKSGSVSILPTYWGYNGTISTIAVLLDATNVYFQTYTANPQVDTYAYRIYKDN